MKQFDPLFESNHLTVVRWVLASAVAIGHLWLLTTGYEPFRIHEWTAGYMAVNGFFVLSGLLIAKSLCTRNDLKAFAVSRTLRIYPALIVILLAFIFIFAPLFSEIPGIVRITDPETWKYALRVLFLGDPENAPGVLFPASLEPEFNGPLWTIRFELAAYGFAALAFAIGAIKGFWRTLGLFLIVQTAYLVGPYLVDYNQLPTSLSPFLRLFSAFLMGMTLWHWPAARRPAWWIVAALIGLFIVFGDGPVGELLATLSLTALIMRLGLSHRKIRPLIKLPDYSYGIYIWHYPVMQAVLFFNPELNSYELGVISFPLFILVSAMSWHLIEKPFLKLKPGRKKLNIP
ncbi:MAG: acyltransferase [Robiginitomaculum sp.]|nr:acyltransferase [Robiginitomaculum sp.]